MTTTTMSSTATSTSIKRRGTSGPAPGSPSGNPRGHNGTAPMRTWAELDAARPELAATMRHYLEQIGCVLRPGSVRNTDQALRSFAGFLLEQAPEVTTLAQVTRRHIEGYKPWLAARPGQHQPRVSPATLAHRLGTLRMFFLRVDEWGWEQAPPRVPMFPATCPARTTRCPRPWTTPPPRSCCARRTTTPRLLVRVTVEVLLRTGLRVSEFTGLRADAVVLIGSGPWLHVPVGKLREDRYLPLHPQLVQLIDDYRREYVPPGHPLLLPRENGRPADRHSVTRILNTVAAAAGLPHPHSCPAPHAGHPVSTEA
ncbi:hypothetical protein DN585_00690 [Intrasporangium calvum]|nr:hypothetical protein DN585_00690 [Intrasporangium calvum]